MNTHQFSYQGVFDLERKHHEDILNRKPLKHLLEDRKIRFVNPMGRFDFCYFGDFYFDTGNVMMLITNDLIIQGTIGLTRCQTACGQQYQ